MNIEETSFKPSTAYALLPPATKLGQGNIFSSVCQEFCPQGRGYGQQAGGTHPTGMQYCLQIFLRWMHIVPKTRYRIKTAVFL